MHSDQTESEESVGYRSYVLIVLSLVYCLSYLDRNLLSILATDIKKDLSISDGDLGFLYGTAFSVTFAIVGVSLARIADTGNRKNLISAAILFWSLLTSLSGMAGTFLQLAACRFGIAIGESGAAPASYSLACDYFSARTRGVALAIVGSGLYLGAGLGLVIGGAILNGWHSAFPVPGSAPLGLKGWQAALLIMGAPGLVIAFLTFKLREPKPKLGEQARIAGGSAGLARGLSVLATMIPAVNIFHLARDGFRLRAAMVNIALAIAIAATVALLINRTGDRVQWIALGAGFYCIASWIQALRNKDEEQYRHMIGSKPLILLILGYAVSVFVGAGLLFWSVPFYNRIHESNAGHAGLQLGLTTAAGGLVGLLCGGVLSDAAYARSRRGRLYVMLVAVAINAGAAIVYFTTESGAVAIAANFFMMVGLAMANGAALASVNDLVPRHLRATASALTLASTYLIGNAIGPYAIGKLSDVLTQAGQSEGQALGHAALWSLAILPLGYALIAGAIRCLDANRSSEDDGVIASAH